MEKLQIFYDGACHLCYREIMHYQKLDKKGHLELIDISAPDFQADKHGLDKDEIQVNMHSKSTSGRVFIGVDTFIEIWRRVKPYHLLIPIVDSKLLRPLFNKAYRVFAIKIRPQLPKRKCDSGVCSPIN